MERAYALTNPISLMLDKPRQEFTREDLLRVIEERQLERITFHYTGLDGRLKELKLPVADRYQAERILADGERVDGSSLFKGLVEVSVSDLYVIPLYATAFLNPFDPGSLDFLCRYLMRDGSLAPFALENILHHAAELLRRTTGCQLYALGELEFYLLQQPEAPLYPNPKQRGYHATGPFSKSGSILNEMVHEITRITGAVKYGHSEVGCADLIRSDLAEIKDRQAEQLEVEFLPAPIEEMGDHLVLARWLIRNIAYRHGGVATFTPKLEEGVAGNGFHVHLQLRRNGAQAMTGGDGQLSAEARKLIGGLCHYAESLTAFGNTVSAAYLRLVPHQEAPTRICWSDLNRSAMIRVPLGWSDVENLAQRLNPQEKSPFRETEGRQTVELRSPDGSAIVHLLLAGLTMAAEWGLRAPQALEIAQRLYATGDLFQRAEELGKLPALPRSCVESSRVLLAQRALYEREGVFPASMIEYVAKLLQAQNDENMNAYLASLPADDRLYETRKIMHQALHQH